MIQYTQVKRIDYILIEKGKRKMEKVWCFNCFGVCIVRLPKNRIEEWNKTHSLFNEKIIDYKE